jgi:glycosyltransferase involved in cell wall biosynthesis
MRLFHLLDSHTNKKTGVPRFSQHFQEAFPQVVNIKIADLATIKWAPGDVVVTDNHMSVRVPQRVQTIVVHHGCAPYHYEVEPEWRSPGTEQMAIAQRFMLHLPNRIFVAPSSWVAEVFKRYAPHGYDPLVLPHWVPLIKSDVTLEGRPFKTVIGDWRNHNKGSDVWEKVNTRMGDQDNVILRQLDFSTEKEKREIYLKADAYLCLSLSEGAPYSVADAEAAGLPIATTEVGNVHEFMDVWKIEDRENIDEVCDAVRGALEGASTRGPSFFEKHNFEAWQAAWKVVIDEAEKRGK